MAVRTAAVTEGLNGEGNVTRVVWTGLTQASSDTGSGVLVRGADRCVQLSGTLGTGGEVPIEGSNDGTNFGALHDLAGNAIVLDAIGQVIQIAECTTHVKCGTTDGDGTTSLTVTLISRR